MPDVPVEEGRRLLAEATPQELAAKVRASLWGGIKSTGPFPGDVEWHGPPQEALDALRALLEAAERAKKAEALVAALKAEREVDQTEIGLLVKEADSYKAELAEAAERAEAVRRSDNTYDYLLRKIEKAEAALAEAAEQNQRYKDALPEQAQDAYLVERAEQEIASLRRNSLSPEMVQLILARIKWSGGSDNPELARKVVALLERIAAEAGDAE